MHQPVSRLALAAAVSLVAGAALAAPAPSWTVDAANSKLGFRGAVNGDAFYGMFRRWTAQIAFDPKNLAGSKAVVGIDVASAFTGDADRDKSLPEPDWFSAKTQPRASFVTNVIKDLGGGRYEADGDLTLRGVKRPLALPFTLAISGDTARMNGSAVINRTAFGVGQGQWKTGDVVATEVTVTVSLTAHKAH
ncbi:MAG TPA: YceI family protein [Caulobacteraceae bacterium]|jgi:polyisoprenoid-binding protein YceI|nr:YceI family protein [Caulobacteraceae bacterium]